MSGGKRTRDFNKKTSGKRYWVTVCCMIYETRINEIVPISEHQKKYEYMKKELSKEFHCAQLH